MWEQIIITALLTSFITLVVAALLVNFFLLPHVERKVELRIKQSASDIEQNLRSRLFAMLRPKSFTRSIFGATSVAKSDTLDPDEDPYLTAPNDTEEL